MIESDVSQTARTAFDAWLTRLGEVFDGERLEQLDELLVDGAYWKDILAFTWDYRTFSGRTEIRDGLRHTIPNVQPTNVRLARNRTPPRMVRRAARDVIEGFFDFETSAGHAVGFARLLFVPDSPEESRAWIFLTTLHELHGFEEHVGERRPSGLEFAFKLSGENWLDQRIATQQYLDREPEVLIVGGGQAGLALAARLGQFGADTLVVEKHGRIGDNWRKRYHSLTLHNEIWANSLPYMPFPPTWPTFVPKDKVADWFEAYAASMELNVWTSTELISASYDEQHQCWDAGVRTPSGEHRSLRPRHLVLATGGASGLPNVPTLSGIEDFAGEVVHTSRFVSGRSYEGRNAIVVGTGNSGHDVAQDLHGSGASVTMIQRSPTCVVSLTPSGRMVYALYSEGPPAEDIDLITAALPYPLLCETYRYLTERTCEIDRALLEGLAKVGFRTDFGVDRTGFHMMHLRRGGGYYINVGCSDLIASGDISLVHTADIDAFVPAGVRHRDGRIIEADLVVLATGYKNQRELVRELLGDEIADRVGPIWGFDDGHHTMRNMWKQTAQPRLWIMGGSLLDCRLHSRFLALQIKADLIGELPPLRRPASSVGASSHDRPGPATIAEC